MATKKRFVIRDNVIPDDRHPYVLLDPEDVIVRVHTRPSVLANLAFDSYGAEEVTHDYGYAQFVERSNQ